MISSSERADPILSKFLESGALVGSSFFREPPEWFDAARAAGEPVVMFALNWSDMPDLVAHLKYDECAIEEPHLVDTCGLMNGVSNDE